MVEPVRHRQTKGAATDMFGLPSPRHTATPPKPAVMFGSAARWGVAVERRFSRATQHNYVRDVGLRKIPRTLP
jgi:hypothetical protein